MPILLRPTDNKHGFMVIGEAYVHGIMEGEMQDLVDTKQACLQSIWLE
jgi:hypothetical protein